MCQGWVLLVVEVWGWSDEGVQVRHNEMLTPAELMVLLHDAEKDIGLQSAKEGTQGPPLSSV